MADRHDSDREVLTSLPRSRPVRRSTKRGARPAAAKGAATASRRKPAAKPRAAKSAAAGAAKRKPARTASAKAAADAAAVTTATSKQKGRARSAQQEQEQPPRVAPKRKVPPAGYAAPSSRAGDTPSSGAAELISTTLQAAAELTQIGLAVARQTLQSMLNRLPKP